MKVKSWNSVAWPGFDKILNRPLSKVSLVSRESGKSKTSELEAGVIRACPNPRSLDGSLKDASSSFVYDSSKRARSSEFSIITLPPDA
jgi:hypothetical protein